MNVCVKLLADDVWAAEYDKTGFLSVAVHIFDRLYLKERPISVPIVPMSTIKRKNEKWRKLNKSKYAISWLMIKILCLVIPPPLWKNSKIEKCQTINLMNVKNIIFDRPLST